MLAYQMADVWRIYADGSSLLRRNPVDPLGAQAGLEYRGPAAASPRSPLPVAAVEVQ